MNIEAEYNRRFDLVIENDEESDVSFADFDNIFMELKRHPKGDVLFLFELGEQITVVNDSLTFYMSELTVNPGLYYYYLVGETEEGEQTILKGNFNVVI